MKKSWIQRKIYGVACKSATKDLEKFLSIIRGYSDENLASLIIISTLVRIDLEDRNILPKNVLNLDCSDEIHSEHQLLVSKYLRLLQKNNMLPQASGAMVWLHSLRSQSFIEIRYMGRQLWKELQRGMPLVKNLLPNFNLTSEEESLVLEEYNYTPVDIEPINK